MGVESTTPRSIEMAELTAQHNPFMLMISPEVVLAAIEKSERLGQLNRHLCRPLDRLAPVEGGGSSSGAEDEDAEPSGRTAA